MSEHWWYLVKTSSHTRRIFKWYQTAKEQKLNSLTKSKLIESIRRKGRIAEDDDSVIDMYPKKQELKKWAKIILSYDSKM